MSQLHPLNMFIDLSLQRPIIQHGFTASPPTRHANTQRTSHGFIPLGTATPLPTDRVEISSPSKSDYFSLSKKEATKSPDAVSYKSHGFIPLCSVPGVEEVDEARDYFSHNATEQVSRASTSTWTSSKRDSISLSPRPHDVTNQVRIPNDRLMHPTRSPVQSRDIFTLRERMNDMYTSMRGSGVCGRAEHDFEAERSRCSLTGYPMKDSVETLELNDDVVEDQMSSREQSLVVHDTQADARLEHDGSQSEHARKDAANESRELWEGEWLHIAGALELPESEASGGDDNGDAPVQTELRTQHIRSRAARSGDNAVSLCSTSTMIKSLPQSNNVTTADIGTPTPKSSSQVLTSNDLAQNMPPANFLYVPRSQARPRFDKRQSSPVPSGLTILKTAMHTSPQYLASLSQGPTISFKCSKTGEICIPSTSLAMLSHFCPPTTISSLLSSDSSTIYLPTTISSTAGLTRVLRFMTRCCLPHSHSPGSELPIPTGNMSAGIETILACQVLGLHADTTRLTSLLLSTQLTSALSSADVDDIWNGYLNSLRSTAFGDAVVWFILRETWKNEDGRAEEVIWMLEQDEYSELKERVRAEVGLRLWRKETRDEFLNRWEMKRERREEKRVKKETAEKEREKRVEGIRRMNREMMQRGGDVRTRDEARAKAVGILDLGVEKALPMTPTTPRVRSEDDKDVASDMGDERETTAAMYAEYVRSLRTAGDTAQLGEHRRQQAGERVFTTRSVPAMDHRAQPSPRTWATRRAALVPRKKLSLWEKLKI
ncbi:hypothetical protein DE146DRAFT_771652 [Phaeosphaeria sp. MPI-PUGE-AT-0046c]|nr:hypothetical protein DE146DRAFT_771652 [Phaeosphaeria sp. MPI-PUGE-AT-0046c]